MSDKFNQRAFERVVVRTPVKLLTRTPEIRISKGWTDDLSPAGARILCPDELAAEEIYVRVMLPGLAEQCFIGRIVRCDLPEPGSFGRKSALHAYGVQFTGLCDEAEAERLFAAVPV